MIGVTDVDRSQPRFWTIADASSAQIGSRMSSIWQYLAISVFICTDAQYYPTRHQHYTLPIPLPPAARPAPSRPILILLPLPHALPRSPPQALLRGLYGHTGTLYLLHLRLQTLRFLVILLDPLLLLAYLLPFLLTMVD